MTTIQIRNTMNKFKNEFSSILEKEEDKVLKQVELNKLDNKIYNFIKKEINKSITSNSEIYFRKMMYLKNDIKINIERLYQ